MDLLEIMLAEPTVKAFVDKNPQRNVKQLLKQLVLYGIHSLQGIQMVGLNFLNSEKTVRSASQQQKKEYRINVYPEKWDSEELSRPRSKKSTPKANQRPSKTNNKEKPLKRKIPKNLLNIPSKIKDEVVKDKRKVRQKENKDPKFDKKKRPESWTGEYRQIRKSELIGKHKISQDLSSFYESEFTTQWTKDVPRKLQAVELPLSLSSSDDQSI